MSASLLVTKLHIPQARSDLVSRPRLVERLQKGLQGPLPLISAPAGSGKTTLLSEWHAKFGLQTPLAWLSLDPGDNDPLRFLTYLTAALGPAAPDTLHAIPALLASPQPPALETLVTLLLEGLGHLSNEVVLVLDDYHVITNLTIHQLLNDLLAHLPPEIHLVLLTRADPPFPLSRLRVCNQLTEIRAADLRFTREETQTFLSTTMGLILSQEQLAMLEARTEGWVAGLQLAGYCLDPHWHTGLMREMRAITRKKGFSRCRPNHRDAPVVFQQASVFPCGLSLYLPCLSPEAGLINASPLHARVNSSPRPANSSK